MGLDRIKDIVVIINGINGNLTFRPKKKKNRKVKVDDVEKDEFGL